MPCLDLKSCFPVSGALDPTGESKNVKLFTYNDLKYATKGFHKSNIIGRGGYGSVYKGILRNGTLVAVKTLSSESVQGVDEFLTEIDMIASVRHPNLVDLIGCCVQGGNRILIYEYAEKGSLDHLLLCKGPGSIELDWSKRAAICLNTAKGLAYLHEELDPYIVHRDIKASNILLDKNLVPKIGDFGLAKIFPDNATHVSTRIAGTIGYLAPEYAMRGQLTKKADIYSFGVLILEIISGKTGAKSLWSGNLMFLLEKTWELYQEERELELVDPELETYAEEEVRRYIKVALFCTQAAFKRRPSMNQVVRMLSKRSHLMDVQLTPPGIIHDIERSVGSGQATAKNSTKENEVDKLDSTNVDSHTVTSISYTCNYSDMVPR